MIYSGKCQRHRKNKKLQCIGVQVHWALLLKTMIAVIVREAGETSSFVILGSGRLCMGFGLGSLLARAHGCVG